MTSRGYRWGLVLGGVLATVGCGLNGATGNRATSSSPRVPAGTPVTAAMAARTRMQAVDFLNARDGFLAGQGTVWATTDGGRQWSEVYRGPADLRAVAFINARDGWAWGWHRLLATTDGGHHWQQVYQAGASPLVSMSWTGARTGYAVIGTPSAPPAPGGPGYALYRTVDGGRRWQRTDTPFHPLAVAFADGHSGWAVGDRRVWHTSDGGRIWMPSYRYGQEVPMAAEVRLGGPHSVWVELIGGSGMNQTPYTVLHRTPGGGWQVVAAVSTAGAGPAPDVPGHSPPGPGSFPGPLAVLGPDSAVLGGVCRACNLGVVDLWRTTNGGASWTRYPSVSGASGIPGPHALGFVNRRQGWLVDGAGFSQVLATTDGGATWRQIFPGVTPVQG